MLSVMIVALSTANYVSASTSVVRNLLCIHRYEGSWTDPHPPYWGGMQMDQNFMRTYGYMKIHGTRISFLKLWGTADHWPIWAQLLAARNAVRARGYWPWPNTARNCGLL